MRATLVLLAAGVLVLGGCGDDDDDDTASPSSETETVEQASSPTNEAEAAEQLGLESVQVGNLNRDYALPDSNCVAQSLFFGADTASEQEGSKGVVIAASGDWGVVLATDSDTPDCTSAWQDAMG